MSDRLHRIHAAPANTRVDIGELSWRADGPNRTAKAAQARRIAVCWNVLEGWPTHELERGVLAEVDEAAYALISEIRKGSARVWSAADRLEAALAKRDKSLDFEHGRKHDCPGCLALGGGEDG